MFSRVTRLVLVCVGVVALVGCASVPAQLSGVKTRLLCQDYANAWAREANNKGFEAGVVWYYTGTGDGHAICWATDPYTGKTLLIEPYPEPHVVTLTQNEAMSVIHVSHGPTLGPKKPCDLFYRHIRIGSPNVE